MRSRDIINPATQPSYGPHRHIGERIANARRQMQMTLREFASATGLSMTQASMIEQGHILPSVLDLLPLIEYAAREVHAGREIIRELDEKASTASGGGA